MEEKATYNAIVHKAALQLMAGESINLYMMALNSALRDHLTQKLNLSKQSSVWTVETMADKAVASVYEYKDDGRTSWCKYFAVNYSREKDGKFTFEGDATEVKPVTTYVPAKGIGLGSVDVKKARDDFDKRWEPVSKSIWAGVV